METTVAYNTPDRTFAGLRIGVELRCVVGGKKVQPSADGEAAPAEPEPSVESRLFNWQENSRTSASPSFGKWEVERLRGAEPTDSLVKQYKAKVAQLDAEEQSKVHPAGQVPGDAKYQGDVLFSYVEEDAVHSWLPADIEESATAPLTVRPPTLVGGPMGALVPGVQKDKPPGAPTWAAERTRTLRRRHDAVQKGERLSDADKALPLHDAGCQVMYICAALPEPDSASGVESNGESLERLICMVTAYQSGVLEMRPGFNSSKNPGLEIQVQQGEVKPYRFNHFGSTYEVVIYNASEKASAERVQSDRQRLDDKRASDARKMQYLVGEMFITTPSTYAQSRMSIMGELQRASGFDTDSLYIEYEWKLPERWESEMPNLLRGCSHMCDRAYSPNDWRGLEPYHHFCHPVVMELMSDDSSVAPVLNLRVSSIDWWGRHTVHGYGTCSMPTSPGSHRTTVATWRPKPSREDMMTPEVQSLDLVGVGKDFSGSAFSKFGFNTVSSGSIEMVVNVVVQRKPELKIGGRQIMRQSASRKTGMSDIVKSRMIAAVMAKARAKTST